MIEEVDQTIPVLISKNYNRLVGIPGTEVHDGKKTKVPRVDGVYYTVSYVGGSEDFWATSGELSIDKEFREKHDGETLKITQIKANPNCSKPSKKRTRKKRTNIPQKVNPQI